MWDGDELLEGYQTAWVTVRHLRADAKIARREGRLDEMAEYELPLNQGREATYNWLRGGTPITPATGVMAAVSDAQIRAEIAAAEALFTPMAPPPPEILSDEVDPTHPTYARGVAETLRDHLERRRQAS